MNRATRMGIGLVMALGAFVFFLLTVGSLGDPQPDVTRIGVEQVLEASSPPAERYGDEELRISGWYAELDQDCRGQQPEGSEVAWLARPCPLRVLMPYQPAETVGQDELEAYGLRLAAPDGRPFPSRAQPGGPNLRLQQLVYVGHFDDPAAADCPAELRETCRNAFVVSDYDGFLR